MVRKKLAAVVAAMGVLQAGYAMALGLGEFSLHSSLNQPLNGEIKLLNLGDLSETELLVKLASSEDFKRVGASRDFFLTNINFEVEIDDKGNGVIKLTTRERVAEPYLDFLVEARWPNGRLLREYTVLLDLPIFSESAAPVVQAPAPAQQVTKQAAASAPVRSTSSSTSARKNLSEGTLEAGSSYRVKQGDTLWKVASKSRPGSKVSVEQTIVSIQRLNPSAFMRGNINNLKAGYILRLPTEAEVEETSSRAAREEISNQNRAWRKGENVEPSTAAQLDATSTEASVSKPATDEARLSLSAGGSNAGAGMGDGEADGSGTEVLRDEVQAAEENLDVSERENEELQNRLQDMEAKLATMQRLIELKDDQLAAIQGSADEQATKPAAAPKPVEKVAEATKPKAKFASKSTPKPEPGVLENPLYMGIAAVVALLAGVMIFLRRRKSAGDDEVLEQVEESANEVVEAEVEAEEATEDSVEDEPSVGDFAEESFAESESVIQPSTDEVETAEEEAAPIQAETGDAIAEADIYIAYGRYQQAVDLLSGAIDKEPARSDLQLKLLEVYLETRDKSGFQQRYAQLQALGNEEATAEVKELLSTVDGVSDWLDDMSSSAAAEMTDADMDADLIEGDGFEEASLESFDNPTIETDAIADIESLDLDGDLDLNLDESDLDTQKTVQFETVDLESEAEEEFELDLDEAFGVSDEMEGEVSLDLDLDSELSLDDEVVAETSEEPAAEIEEEGFDLDLDGDEDLDLDLDLNELSLDTDLGELEAEFDGELGDTDLGSLNIEESTEEATETESSEPDIELELDEEAEPEIDLDLSEDFELDESSEADSEAEVDAGLDYEPVSTDDSEKEATAEPVAEESFDSDVEESSDAEDFDFLSDTDEVATKLDLARAYIDMGDTEGARDILDEVAQEGDDSQKQEASSLLERI